MIRLGGSIIPGAGSLKGKQQLDVRKAEEIFGCRLKVSKLPRAVLSDMAARICEDKENVPGAGVPVDPGCAWKTVPSSHRLSRAEVSTAVQEARAQLLLLRPKRGATLSQGNIQKNVFLIIQQFVEQQDMDKLCHKPSVLNYRMRIFHKMLQKLPYRIRLISNIFMSYFYDDKAKTVGREPLNAFLSINCLSGDCLSDMLKADFSPPRSILIQLLDDGTLDEAKALVNSLTRSQLMVILVGYSSENPIVFDLLWNDALMSHMLSKLTVRQLERVAKTKNETDVTVLKSLACHKCKGALDVLFKPFSVRKRTMLLLSCFESGEGLDLLLDDRLVASLFVGLNPVQKALLLKVKVKDGATFVHLLIKSSQVDWLMGLIPELPKETLMSIFQILDDDDRAPLYYFRENILGREAFYNFLMQIPVDVRTGVLNVKDAKEGKALLHLSALLGDEGMVAVILAACESDDARAELFSQGDYKGRTPYIVAKHQALRNRKKTCDAFEEYSVDVIGAKETYARKKMLNVFDRSLGSSYYDGSFFTISFSWLHKQLTGFEGTHPFAADMLPLAAFHDVLAARMSFMVENSYSAFEDSCHSKLEEIWARVSAGESVMIEGGWKRHSISFVVSKDRVLVGNKGQYARRGEGGKYRPILGLKGAKSKEVLARVLQLIDRGVHSTALTGRDIVYVQLPRLLGMPEAKLHMTIHGRGQRTGNCYYASAVMGMYGQVVYDYYQFLNQEIAKDPDFFSRLIESLGVDPPEAFPVLFMARILGKRFYKAFRQFSRCEQLKKYIAKMKILDPDWDPMEDGALMMLYDHFKQSKDNPRSVEVLGIIANAVAESVDQAAPVELQITIAMDMVEDRDVLQRLLIGGLITKEVLSEARSVDGFSLLHVALSMSDVDLIEHILAHHFELVFEQDGINTGLFESLYSSPNPLIRGAMKSQLRRYLKTVEGRRMFLEQRDKKGDSYLVFLIDTVNDVDLKAVFFDLPEDIALAQLKLKEHEGDLSLFQYLIKRRGLGLFMRLFDHYSAALLNQLFQIPDLDGAMFRTAIFEYCDDEDEKDELKDWLARHHIDLS